MATKNKAVTATEAKEVPPVKSKAVAKKVPAAKKVGTNRTAAPVAAKPVAVAAAPAVKAKAPAKAPVRKIAKVVHAEIEPAQRANYIEVAAFYIAERRGFAPGNPQQDYLNAAAEIDRMIAAGHFDK